VIPRDTGNARPIVRVHRQERRGVTAMPRAGLLDRRDERCAIANRTVSAVSGQASPASKCTGRSRQRRRAAA
jgi:hypothetical protein